MGLNDLMALVLVLVRVGSMLAFLPFLGGGVIPGVIKALTALAISVVLFPFVEVGHVLVALSSPLQFFLIVAAEVTFGALMGFCALLVFKAIRDAGELIGHQMGMGLAFAADPVSGVQATLVANFCEATGVLVFFAVGGHRWMLAAIHDSLTQWPIGSIVSAEFIKCMTIGAVVRSFAMAFQLAAPLVLLMFLVSLLMAVVARLVPEINVLIIGFPVRVGMGLIGLLFLVPVMVRYGGEVSRLMVRFFSAYPGGA